MEIEISRVGMYVHVEVSDVFQRVEPQGLFITLDEASVLREKLGRALNER